MFGFMFLQGKIDDTGYNYIEHNGLKIYYRDETELLSRGRQRTLLFIARISFRCKEENCQ